MLDERASTVRIRAMTADAATSAAGSLAAGIDRAHGRDSALRARRDLPTAQAATGAQIERRIERLAATPDDASLDRLARAALDGDEAAREALVTGMLPAVVAAARRYAGGDVEVADLVQDAVLGVLRALSRFEPARGVPFTAYARWWIRQALQQSVAEQSRAVRLPANALRDVHALKEAREALAQSGERPAGG